MAEPSRAREALTDGRKFATARAGAALGGMTRSRVVRFAAPLFVMLLAASAIGCNGGNYARSAYGTVGGYSLKNARATPPNLLVARKIDRPLYLVLDPARVRNEWSLATAPCEIGGDGCERFKLFDVQEFVRRDLKRAMESYFTRVELVAPGQPIPAGAAVVADVKIDDIRIHPLVRGPLTYEIIQMTWGFALRRSEDKDYAYSFAGTSESNDSYVTFEAGCGQLIENAIPSMLKKWTESGGIEALQREAGG